MIGGDLLAEGSRQARLQAADLLSRFAGLVLAVSISTLSDAALSAVCAQPGDKSRLDLRLGVRDLPAKWSLTNDR